MNLWPNEGEQRLLAWISAVVFAAHALCVVAIRLSIARQTAWLASHWDNKITALSEQVQLANVEWSQIASKVESLSDRCEAIERHLAKKSREKT